MRAAQARIPNHDDAGINLSIYLVKSRPGVIFKPMIKGMIFDMDGTLTRPCIDLGEVREKIRGLNPGLPIYEQALQWPEPEKERALAILCEAEMNSAAKAEPGPGVYDLIRILDQRGIRKAIFTRNNRSALDLTLSRLGLSGAFDPMVTRDLGLKLKPDPDPVFYILKQWRLAPEQALVVGDFHFDLMAGKAAGCPTVFLSQLENCPRPEKADYLIRRLDQVIGIMEELDEAGPDQG